MIGKGAWRAAVMVTGMAMAAAAAWAEDRPVTLSFSVWLPPQHPLVAEGIPEWISSIEEASDGTIAITVYPAQQLGQAKDHYDMARDGIADIAWVNPGYTPGRFPVIAAADLPFLIDNATRGSAAVDSWYRAYGEQEMADVKLCLVQLHDPGTVHAKQRVMRPEDISGLKVRPAQATLARLVHHLGGSSVQVTAPEAREALERGVADAITFPWNSVLLFGLDNAVGYHMDAPFYVTTFVWVMNQRRYDRLSPNQRQVIDDHCTPEWAERVSTAWAEWERAGRDHLLANGGHTVYPISDDDLAAWREAAEPLREEWAANVERRGVDPEAAMAALIESLEQHDSAY